MSRWHDALRAYRKTSNRPARDLLFILAADDRAGAAVAASCEPAMILQGDPSGDAWLRGMLDGAFRRGVRRIVVCGHQTDDRSPSQHMAEVVARAARLQADPEIGPLIRELRVEVIGLWFHQSEGDVYQCSADGRSRLLGDLGFAELLGLDQVPTEMTPLTSSPQNAGGPPRGRLEVVLGEARRRPN